MRKFEEKRTWVRQHLGDISSDAELLSAFAKHFGMRDESKASAELKQIMEADRATEDQFSDSTAQRHWALGQKLLDMMVADKAHGPAAQVWRAMQTLKGLDRPQQVQVEVSQGPNPEIVRARIAKLMQDKQVREQAEAVGVDLDEIASGKNVSDPGSSAWHLRSSQRGQTLLESPKTEPDPAESVDSAESADSEPHDAGPENPLAIHLANARELGHR